MEPKFGVGITLEDAYRALLFLCWEWRAREILFSYFKTGSKNTGQKASTYLQSCRLGISRNDVAQFKTLRKSVHTLVTCSALFHASSIACRASS